MIKGIGVDLVDIDELKELINRIEPAATSKLFSPTELELSKSKSDPYEYLAARFAAKEAVTKALSPLLAANQALYESIDMRIVETLNKEDGSPYIVRHAKINEILQKVEVSQLHISLSTEKGMACAFVVAEG